MQVTTKQKRIADLVAKGLSNAEIAERLGNTEGSIEQHLVKLFKHLGIHSRVELRAKADRLEVRGRRGSATR